ncbi:MAG: TonB-dependent receptor [Xanthomonadaceae bacterium]|nr:TonB-dependent receptor [Xanthomonadaceae bacterium]
MTNPARLSRNPLALALAAAMLFPALVQAQDQSGKAADGKEKTKTETSDQQKTEKTLDTVTVVGSRIKRAEIEGASPVTIITKADIEREGFQTVADMLQTLNQGTSRAFTGDQAVTGFSPNAQVVNLRSLGPGYTLTLVNGRRPADYPQPYNRDRNVVNVRAIPTSIIQRTEVLTGGASAIYGSDAVAGVVNIVTKDAFDGQSLRVRVGSTEEGGGNSVNFEYSGGHTSDRWNSIWAFQYGKTDPVFGTQRDFLADTRNGPLGPNFTNPALSLVVLRGTAGQGVPANHNTFYPGQAVCDAFGYTEKTTATRGHYCGSFTQPGSRSISNYNKTWSTYGRTTFDISDNLQFFANATYWNSDAKASSGTEFWGTSGDRFNTTKSGGSTAFYYDPQFLGVVQLQRVFNPFELGGAEAATTLFKEKTWDITMGLNGTLGSRFDWEAYFQYSRYDYSANRPRLLAKAVHDYFLGPIQGYASTSGATTGASAIYPIYTLNLNRWVTPITPDIYQSFSTRVQNDSTTTSSSFGFTLSGDLFDLPAGPVGFAGILEGVRQTMDLRSDPRLDPLRPIDNQTVYNLVSSGRTQGERDRYALGGEFRVPLFKMLTAQVAGRYDRYNDISDIKGAFTYNLGLEFRPASSVLLRTNYATSFRAPDLQLIYAQGAASYASAVDQYACYTGTGAAAGRGPRTYTQCSAQGDPTIYSMQTVIAGNSKLREEKGKSFGAGFVWDITPKMNVSVDYFRIKLEDAASQLGSLNILDAEAACRIGHYQDASRPAPSAAYCTSILNLVTRFNSPGAPNDGYIERINDAYVNTALTDTSGIDMAWNWTQDIGRWGSLRFNTAYSILMTYRYKLLAEDDLFDYRDSTSISQRSRFRGSVSWSKDSWGSTLYATRLGSARSAAGVPGTNTAGESYGHRIKPYITYNWTLTKRFNEHLSGELTVVNLTNNQYRYDASNTGYPFYYYYQGADPLGRRFFLGATYKF